MLRRPLVSLVLRQPLASPLFRVGSQEGPPQAVVAHNPSLSQAASLLVLQMLP